MKRRNWLWFVASALLAVLAGVLAMFLLRDTGEGEQVIQQQEVVVAIAPIAANNSIRADRVRLDAKDVAAIPSGAFVSVTDLEKAVAKRDISIGEIIVRDDVYIPDEGDDGGIPDDKVAVALPAEDILSKWGAVLPGDHVDLLITMDVILESPMYPWNVRTQEELSFYSVARDQSMDQVSVLTLQNLVVLQIIEEPLAEGQEDDEGQLTQRPRALVVLADPQDAVVLRYLLDVDVVGNVTVAKRSPENEALFNVQPVNINYLMLRYGVVLPQPLE